jgi:hypothetical protein
MIIGLSGYSGSGKDTVGQIIQKLTAKEIYGYLENTWEIKKFAGKLKTIASMITGIPEFKFEDQEFKKTFLESEWDSYGIIRGNSTQQVAVQLIPHDPDGIWLKSGDNKQVHNRMTVRDFLQKLGTDALRDRLHSNTWINALMCDYTTESNWVITDTRFVNEAEAIKKAGGIVIRIDRPGFTPINAHPSETSLDVWDYDYKIMNGSDIEALSLTVNTILKKHNLLNEDYKTKD